MTDLQDLWVETSKGLVRADQVVHARVVSRELRVTLSLIETDTDASVAGINQVVHQVATVSPDDGGGSAYALADFISKCRGEGKRGVIVMDQETNLLRLDAFDPLEADEDAPENLPS